MFEKILIACVSIVACVFLLPLAVIVSLGKICHCLWDFKAQVALLLTGLIAVAAFSLLVAFSR